MKLNQVIAIEKGVKSTANKAIDDIHKAAQKPALFDGHVKTYRPNQEDDPEGKATPPDKKNVQFVASNALRDIARLWRELFDVAAQKDFANCDAKADVKVGAEVILSAVPVTNLLFLEKQLTDLKTIIGNFPVLDPAERWAFDDGAGYHRTEPTLTQRTKKVQRPLVVLQPTKEHPGQATVITEDIVTGNWELTKFSGAMPAPEKQAILERVEALQRAIKTAREEANMIEAPACNVGSKVFAFVLGREI